MASEQYQPQCDCGPRHRSARAAGHAATAAVFAASPGRRASVMEPTVTDFQLIRNSKDTGSGAFSSHASAGAAIAHSKSLSYKESKDKGKQPTMKRPSSLVRDYHDVEAPHTNRYSLEGFRAASSAVKESRAAAAASSLPPSHPICDLRGGEWPADEHRSVGHPGALQAASGAFVSSRQRVESPPSRPAGREATASAASAANVVSRPLAEGGPEPSLPALADPSSIHRAANESAQLDVSRAAHKLEEQNRKNVERAAAVSLARDGEDPSKRREEVPSLYGLQPSRPRTKRTTISDPAALQRAVVLQYAAQSRAAETIAEMSDGTITDYQKYYGTEPRPLRSRLSIRRRRPLSVGDTFRTDAQRSREIQNQMSVLRTKLNEVDEKKQKDRDLLMEAARKNVDALIHDMEQRVYAETGRAPTSTQKELEEEQTRPESETEAPTTEVQTDVGGEMIDVGGGQFIDPAVLEETARLRVRPTLDEIDERVEKQRARDLEERLDREEEERRRDVERQRAADIRAEKRQRARPGLWPGLDRMYDRAEEKRARKIEERLDKDEKKRKKAMESQREADTRTEQQQLLEEQRGRKKRLPTRSKPAKESEPPVQRDTTTGVPDGGAEAEEGVLPEMVPSTGQEGGVAAAAFVGDGAATKPARSESRFKSWFRGRRANRPTEVAQEPQRDPTERESRSRSAAGTGTGADETRRAPLSSHPVTGDDLAQMQNDVGRSSASTDLAPQPSVQPSVEESHPENVSRDSQEPAANGVATQDDNETGSAAQSEQRTPDNSHHDAHHHGAPHLGLAELEDLRETAAEHGLPMPPTAAEAGSMSTARWSRFSERFSDDE